MKEKGQSLIEIIIAVGIFVIITSGIITLALGSLISQRQGGEITQASFYMQQGAEATRSIQEFAYNKLAYYADGATHGIDNSGGSWTWSGSNNTKDQFTRTIQIEDVLRDANGDIGAGTNDLETKKVTVSTDWSFALGRANQVQSIFYLTNWNRELWTESTKAEFDDGTFNNTESTDDSGGEIKLTSGGGTGTTWQCGVFDGSEDLPSNAEVTDVVTVNSISYVVTLNNAGAEFYILDVSDSSGPYILGSLDIGTSVNGLHVNGDYAYLATDENNQELMVINITDPNNLSVDGSYNTDSNSNANDVFVSSEFAYLVTNINSSGGTNPEFYILDVSNPVLPSLEGDLEIDESIDSVFYDDDKAYIVTSNNNAEMQIINVAVKNSPSSIGSFDAPTSANGNDVFVFSNTAYLTTDDGGGNEFYILNVTNPGAISTIGSYDVGGNAFSVFIDASLDHAFIGNSQNSSELKVLDISIPSTPSLLKSFDAGDDVGAVFYANNRAYIGSNNNDQDFQIYQTGPGNTWECTEQTGIYDTSYSVDATDVVAVGDRAYFTTLNSGGAEFYILDISDPTIPTLLGSLNLGDSGNALFINGNYAFIASSQNNQELMIVDITDPSSLSIDGSYNADSNVNATDVFISGNYAYLTTLNNTSGGVDPEFYILNISTPTNPTLQSFLEPNTNLSAIFYDNNKAYLTADENNQELIITDVADKSNPSIIGTYDSPDNSNARDVWVVDDNAYLVRDNLVGSDPEFQVLDVADPGSVSEIGSLDLENDGFTIHINGNLAFVGTSATDQEAQIIDISNPANPSRINSLNANGNVYGTYYANNSVYLATANNSEEFQIWNQVTTSGSGYSLLGSYESSAFGPVANFNLIKWSEIIPTINEDLKVQITTAPDNSGAPGVWYPFWCGPSGKIGADTDFFIDPIGGIINPDHIGDNWIKYKLTLSGNSTDTPALTDITVNYKP